MLGPTSELADISLSLIKGEGAVKLVLSYEDLKAMDDVSVTLIPEKKGMVFKHVEYLVESKVCCIALLLLIQLCDVRSSSPL